SVVGLSRSTQSLDAYDLYNKGRRLWDYRSRDSVIRAIEYFKAAIDRDTTFSLAYAGLADAYATGSGEDGYLPWESISTLADHFAVTGLRMDSSRAETHASLAHVRQVEGIKGRRTAGSGRHEFSEAEDEFRAAIQRDPKYAPAHSWLGLLLGRDFCCDRLE